MAIGFNGPAQADDRLVRLAVPETLVNSGLMKFMLPRFSLKMQVRVQIVPPGADADAVLGATGTPVLTGEGTTWSLKVSHGGHESTEKFAAWITSEVGQRAITGFKRDGKQVFSLPVIEAVAPRTRVYDGDAVAGRRLSVRHCGRCHASIEGEPMRGIGSTPSFFVLRALPDWDDRFRSFFARNPHPSFTQIDDLTPRFAQDRPPPVFPVTMTLENLDAILAYVSTLQPADLGAPIVAQ